MGSWFSTGRAAPPASASPTSEEWAAACHHLLKNPQFAISIPRQFDAFAICHLANCALEQYNSKHPGALEFRCPKHLITESELKAACVGFRGDLWYHLNFFARRREGGAIETRRFFAELRFEPCSDCLIAETCIVLEEPLCHLRSSCAFCPDESEILHPSEFGCGKQGHEREFFRHRCGTDGRTKVLFSDSEMLHIPLMLGAHVPQYRLDYVQE